MFVPLLFVPLGLGGEELGPGGSGALLFLLLGRGILRAGELDEETRAGHVAGEGFVDEGAGDAVGFEADQGVDGAAETGSAAAGGEAAKRGCGGFAARPLAARLGRMDGLRMVGDFDGLVQLSHLPDEVVLDSFRVAQNGIVFGKWKVLKRWRLGELGLDGEEQSSVISGQWTASRPSRKNNGPASVGARHPVQ